jgi:hypothetical protein
MAEKQDPEVIPQRTNKVGSYLIREGRREEMAKAIASGLHFEDAAEKAGIPYEVALSASRKDPEFMAWYDESRSKPRIEKQIKRHKPKTSLQIKSDFVNKLSQVGLFDKIADMAEMADPNTEEGKQVLGFFMRYIVKDILPKETAAKVEHTEKAAYDTMTDAELLEMLQDRRQQRLAYDEELNQADGQRSSHTQKYIEQAREYYEQEGEQGTDT